MLIQQKILIRGEGSWTVEREHSWRVGEGWLYCYTQALCCPVCLKVWAVMEVPETAMQIVGQPCRRCPSPRWALIPGSILTDIGLHEIDWPLLGALPSELLRREFDMHMAYMEKHDGKIQEETNRN